MSDFIDELTQDIRDREPDSAVVRRSRWVTRRLRRYAVGNWIWSYVGLTARNFLAPTLVVAGTIALIAGFAGWSTVPWQVWLVSPAIGWIAAGAYAYRDKPPRSMTAGELIIARRNIKREIAELEREQVTVLKGADEQPGVLLKQEDLRHLLGHCEMVCRDIAAIDASSAEALRDAAARVAKDSFGDYRYGAIEFPVGPNPPAALIARNLGSWIAAAQEITDVLAPPGHPSPYDR